MEIQSIGSGIGGVDLLQLAELAAHMAQSHGHAEEPEKAVSADDFTSQLLRDVSESDLPKLTSILEASLQVSNSPELDDLTRNAIDAVNRGDIVTAAVHACEIATIDPQRAQSLASEPELLPVRQNIERFLSHLTNAARIDAEGRLARAEHALENAGEHMLHEWETKPALLMNVAHQLYDAGGYPNYVRSGQLAQAIIDASPWLSAGPNGNLALEMPTVKIRGEESLFADMELLPFMRQTWSAVRTSAAPKLQRLWQRAPLLLLLAAWFAIGMIGSSAALTLHSLWPETWALSYVDTLFEAWALGFLGLVGLSFYAGVRGVRW